MVTNADKLEAAYRLHESGVLPQAAQLYREVLQGDPNLADVWHLLGVVAMQTRNFDQAADHIRHALTLRPDTIQFLTNLGEALRGLNQLPEARECYERVVRLDPLLAAPHCKLGHILWSQGQWDEAENYYREALRLQPELGEAHAGLGNELRRQGKLDSAAASYREAIRFQPFLGAAHCDLGAVLLQKGDYQAATESCRQALRLDPRLAEAHNNLGFALFQLGKNEEAVRHCREAVRLQPNQAYAHNNLGNVLWQLDEREEATACFQEALRLQPRVADVHCTLGDAHQKQGEFQQALDCFDQAIRLEQNFAQCHRLRAMLRLLLGDFEQGWPEYAWRKQCDDFKKRSFSQPLWNGSDLQGRTILVHAEQGLGDMIQFARYLPLVKERGGRVILECFTDLQSLLATCPGANEVLVRGARLPPFDVYASLLDLPGIFRTTLTTIPDQVPYLCVDPALVEHWRQKLGSEQGLKVGIVWQGDPKHQNDRSRSMPLVQLAPLAAVPGVRLFSLQKGHGAEQIMAIKDRFELRELGREFQAASWTFMDTAAVIMNLDLIVSVDTAVAHLAGALAKPVWVLLPAIPEWRWLLERDDSPWYPTARLFRQTRSRDWGEVVERVRRSLEQLVMGLEHNRDFA